MANNLTDLGTFNIASLLDGNPLAGTYAGSSPQNVVLNGPVTNWLIEKVADNAYRFGVGNYAFSGIMNDEIIATVDQIQNTYWYPVYHENVDAYTIELAGDAPFGWTVIDTVGTDPVPIAFQDINDASAEYPLTQLFRFWQTG